ncbi:hypothetical protein K2173_017768 [Erythroxylum novogranatense]|uniref:Uncharacterized protein n=1 Tax=Erythroxylum novogranatense TaxID=1862640 RepID=A0AAV8T2V2_9ROSI|nr:hypothetical protein K2173_017768 [Erythroxylum novogranatense]
MPSTAWPAMISTNSIAYLKYGTGVYNLYFPTIILRSPKQNPFFTFENCPLPPPLSKTLDNFLSDPILQTTYYSIHSIDRIHLSSDHLVYMCLIQFVERSFL